MYSLLRFLCTSLCRCPTCASSDFKNNFPYYGQEVSPTSTWPSSYEKADHWHLIEEMLIPGLIRSPPKLTHCDFPFTEYETQSHFSYLPGTFREQFNLPTLILLRGRVISDKSIMSETIYLCRSYN